MPLPKDIFFFLLLFLVGCISKENNQPAEIIWKENKAVEIILSSPGIVALPAKDFSTVLKVELGDSGEPMLGEYFKRDGRVVFHPVVPFTRGMHYHVLANNIILAELNIPMDENAGRPKLSIFPSTDTVPENILKLYLRFSEPMVEGKSLRHIHLLNQAGDTLQGTFLDLQPELWNIESTLLTLWFDPGRVKRDLIPNREQGSPILKDQDYKLIIDGVWKSKAGREIGNTTFKKFIVQERDETIPDINHWVIQNPNSESRNILLVQFSEVLDYSLIQSTIAIVNPNKNIVDGTYEILKQENGIRFTPTQNWQKGEYSIVVETKLEDLAGNNLLRPFDRDVTQIGEPMDKKSITRKFRIK